MITATLTCEDTAEALGIAVTHRTPILALCRKLEEAGHADQPMTVLRDGKPCLNVSSIHAAAKRTVVENDKTAARWGKFVPFVRFMDEEGVAVPA
ncbi:hypothetical protein ABNQ39_00060 (plasmid) [Azospirillum sp. A26]|uniref:hypothetical protein n=1 Tax=Azospirillum sp. A26 TaxID=3160607 RepID=UPI00366C8004